MTRSVFIERLRRQIYGGFPVDESTITDNLVNEWISDGCGIAAKQNYKDNLQLEGVAFVNNSFYSTFKEIPISANEQFLYAFSLPQIPVGIGTTEGISRLVLKDDKANITLAGVPLAESQIPIARSLRPIPNKFLFYPEGKYGYIISTMNLTDFTAMVTMISGGDATNLDSELNIPPDYIPVIVEYIKSQLSFERAQPVDSANDGSAAVRTT